MESIGWGLPSLQSLDVTYCRKLTDKGFLAVSVGCRNLKTLRLAGCKLVSNVLLQALSTNCHNLEELSLQGCSNITDSGLTDLVKGCKRISFLDMNKCSNVGDVGISNLSEACAYSLKTLKLLDCFKVGDESILSLARFCRNLETLIIGGCRDVSDESIKSLASACKKSLRNLRMDWCCNISDASLRCIFVECRNLEAIDIGCCEEVTDGCFQDLGRSEIELPLKVLKISNCPKITVAGMQLVVERCGSLEYIDVRSCPRLTEAECRVAGLMFPERCKVNFTGSLTEPEVLI